MSDTCLNQPLVQDALMKKQALCFDRANIGLVPLHLLDQIKLSFTL